MRWEAQKFEEVSQLQAPQDTFREKMAEINGIRLGI